MGFIFRQKSVIIDVIFVFGEVNMFTDLIGKKRFKLGLHMHTTVSDGKVTPEEAIRIYREAGYDGIALTDHWKWNAGYDDGGITIISGAEYNIGGNDSAGGVYHIVAIGAEKEPNVKKTDDAQTIIDGIREAGGIAVLAHPAWSLNSPEQILKLKGLSGVEIYNTASGIGYNLRPYSGYVVDLLANKGFFLPLIAADDVHSYELDKTTASIMVDVSDGKNDVESLIKKIRDSQFYATTGPEVHISLENGKVTVRCTPACVIAFYSQLAWSYRAVRGDGITYGEYVHGAAEKWIRAEVTDNEGRTAWSNIIKL